MRCLQEENSPSLYAKLHESPIIGMNYRSSFRRQKRLFTGKSRNWALSDRKVTIPTIENGPSTQHDVKDNAEELDDYRAPNS
ncbi:MAG: hypothetical protein ABJA60_06050 [Nitrosospira sp.]